MRRAQSGASLRNAAHLRGESYHLTEEEKRLQESITHAADWKTWGPYLTDPAWGTVREAYSPDGSPWDYFPPDPARSRLGVWGGGKLLPAGPPQPVPALAVHRPHRSPRIQVLADEVARDGEGEEPTKQA